MSQMQDESGTEMSALRLSVLWRERVSRDSVVLRRVPGLATDGFISLGFSVLAGHLVIVVRRFRNHRETITPLSITFQGYIVVRHNDCHLAGNCVIDQT